MSRQKTYWARLPGREVRHLWTHNFLGMYEVTSACGLFDWYGFPQSKGRKCKNCERALAK